MSAPLDEQYLTWLYSQVGSVRLKNPARTYWSLLKQMYTTKFVWIIPNDDNRVEDGRDLRYEFIDSCGIDEADIDPVWLDLECSMLEMMVALSRLLSFEGEGAPRRWFWHLIDNLELTGCTDKVYDNNIQERVGEILEIVIWRLYSPSGRGGLFPLQYEHEDQRDVELWYQLSAYLLEME